MMKIEKAAPMRPTQNQIKAANIIDAMTNTILEIRSNFESIIKKNEIPFYSIPKK